MLPLLLFAARDESGGDGDGGEPVELTISGGTNVSFSPSYEYLDQMLLPALEAWFGVRVERRLEGRGWSSGGASRGSLWFRIQPLRRGTTLRARRTDLMGLGGAATPVDFEIKSVEVTIITPADMHGELEDALREDLAGLFPGARLDVRRPEESGHESRIYVLLVARSETLRWGRDVLYGGKRKGKGKAELSRTVARAAVRALRDEIQKGGVVDEFLQDQLVIFQALAQGRTSFPRRAPKMGAADEADGYFAVDAVEERLEKLRIVELEGLRKDRVKGPLGDPETDSSHTRTARWVTSEILGPRVKWYHEGLVCEGIGLVSGSEGVST